ncbi:hypothetical protein ACU1JV_05030 [Paenibacillus sp. T2-29]|uniref:hypothetical protein n=1 Tax=Paenibacillus TaxID=44249 RepID=UPI0039BD295D
MAMGRIQGFAPKKKAQTFLLAKLKFDVIMILGLLLKRQNPGHGTGFPCVGFCLFFLYTDLQ